MKNYFLFILLFSSFFISNKTINAQNYFEGFEDIGCKIHTGCLSGWSASHGQPVIWPENTPPADFDACEGDGMAYLMVGGAQNQNTSKTGEGIFLDYEFQEGFCYDISFKVRVVGNGSRLIVGLSNSLSSCMTSCLERSSGCGNNSTLPNASAFPVHDQNLSEGAWQTINIDIDNLADDFSQLWFRPQTKFGANCLYLFIDAVEIIETPKPTANAQLVNSDGEPTTQFCYGEDIFLDAQNSKDYTSFFISIWERDAQGNTINYARFNNPNFRPGLIPSPFNISADIRTGTWASSNGLATDWAFCPGGNYEVQLALRNTCDGWEAIYLPFTVECCEDEEPLDASFELEIKNSNGTSYDIVAVNYNLYEGYPGNCPITHQWCVYTSQNSDGPYTYWTTLTGPDFAITGEDGVWYTVIHNVSSPCGAQACFGANVCRNCENGLQKANCEYCGPIPCPSECSSIEEPCDGPEPEVYVNIEPIGCFYFPSIPLYFCQFNLSVLNPDPSFIYSWNVTSNSGSGNGGQFSGPNVNIDVSNSKPDSYTVTLKINDEESGCIVATLGEEISCPSNDDCTVLEGAIGDVNKIINSYSHNNLTIYPNPFSLSNSDYLKLGNIPDVKFGDAISIDLVNISGQTLKHINLNKNSDDEINMDGITPGIYFIKISDGNELMQVEKIIVME